MHFVKQNIFTIISWCIFAALISFGMSQANELNRFSSASVRFDTPISGQTAYRARLYSVNNPDTFWPTFWHQDIMTIFANNRSATSPTILFSGDFGLVWPATFVAGSQPSSIDEVGVALSEGLAYSLWGSTDIVGMQANIAGEYRTVRGVFEGSQELFIISFHIEDTAQYWTVAELSGGVLHPTRQDAEMFALMSGMGMPNFVIMGGANAVSRGLSVLPFAIPIFYVILLGVCFIRRYYPITATPILLGGCLLLAVTLPALLNQLPPWIIPTRWGDFAFWGDIGTQAMDALREFLALPPLLRDVEFRMGLVKQIAIFIPTICVGIVACRTTVKYGE